MTVLEIVQEAAKRLCIMIPQSIVQPNPPDSSLIDYDANLLVASLTSAVRQYATLHKFNWQIQVKSVNMSEEFSLIYKSADKSKADMISYDMVTADVEQILGDGIVIAKLVETNAQSIIVKQKEWVFRELTKPDYLRLMPPSLQTKNIKGGVSDADDPAPLTAEEKKKIYYANLPSEDVSETIAATNVESGYVLLGDTGKRRALVIVNNMIAKDDFTEDSVFMASFVYRTSYGFCDIRDVKKDKPEADDDQVLVPDELAVLGTVINFKSYYGFDYTLELGQQKALIEMYKVDQENMHVTSLTKKQYYQPKRT